MRPGDAVAEVVELSTDEVVAAFVSAAAPRTMTATTISRTALACCRRPLTTAWWSAWRQGRVVVSGALEDGVGGSVAAGAGRRGVNATWGAGTLRRWWVLTV